MKEKIPIRVEPFCFLFISRVGGAKVTAGLEAALA